MTDETSAYCLSCGECCESYVGRNSGCYDPETKKCNYHEDGGRDWSCKIYPFFVVSEETFSGYHFFLDAVCRHVKNKGMKTGDTITSDEINGDAFLSRIFIDFKDYVKERFGTNVDVVQAVRTTTFHG